jgi:ketosteroid isomerase-like protein
MKLTRTLGSACYFPLLLITFLLIGVSQYSTFARIHEEGGNVKNRIAIQEKLLYAYAYAYDSKDCVTWANLFATDAVLNLGPGMKASGRDAILRGCIERQKNVVGNIKTHHNMTNIVFDQLTERQAKTRTYCVLTWLKPGDMTPNVQSTFVYRDVIVKQSDGRWLFKERVGVDPPNL